MIDRLTVDVVVSEPKIETNRMRKISGSTTVKNTDAGSRQNCFWS